jgi:hypothetical protein
MLRLSMPLLSVYDLSAAIKSRSPSSGYHHPMRVFHRAESMLLKKKADFSAGPFFVDC